MTWCKYTCCLKRGFVFNYCARIARDSCTRNHGIARANNDDDKDDDDAARCCYSLEWSRSLFQSSAVSSILQILRAEYSGPFGQSTCTSVGAFFLSARLACSRTPGPPVVHLAGATRAVLVRYTGRARQLHVPQMAAARVVIDQYTGRVGNLNEA